MAWEPDEDFDDGGTPDWRARNPVLPRPRRFGMCARLRRRFDRISTPDLVLLPLRIAIGFTAGLVTTVLLLVAIGVL